MKSILPFFALLLLFSSCTTAYKSGQTPDDVYFSPTRPQDEYVRTETSQPKYQYNEETEDDRYLRMKVRNRRTWSDLDYYYSDPYAFNYYNRFNNYNSLYYNTPWNLYSSWNYYYNPYNAFYNPYYYNPYGSKVIVGSRRAPVYNRPRSFNLNVYNPPMNDSYNQKQTGARRSYRTGDNRVYNYNTNNGRGTRNNNSNSGSLRTTFGNNNSSNNNTSVQQSTPIRSDRSTSTPSASPSRSSTNAPTRKF